MSTVQVRQRGTMTLPIDVRQRYGIQDGDTYQLVDLDGILVFVPMTPMVPALAREIERAWLKLVLRLRRCWFRYVSNGNDMLRRSMVISIHRPRVFLDADVIFAGSASPQEHSASQVILSLGER